jgi:hypothetical protein
MELLLAGGENADAAKFSSCCDSNHELCSCFAMDENWLEGFGPNDEHALEFALAEHDLQVNQVGAEVK